MDNKHNKTQPLKKQTKQTKQKTKEKSKNKTKILNSLINKNQKKKEEEKVKQLRKILFEAIKIHNPSKKGLLSNINKKPDEIHLNSPCSSPT